MEYDVLFVDDEESIRKLYSSILKNHNYSVSTANTGVEALRLLEINSYRLIFLDLNMPELNGLEALRKIRENDRKIPTYIITGFDYKYRDELKRLREAGIEFELLKKPIEKDAFISIADDALLKRSTSNDPALKFRLYVAGNPKQMGYDLDKLQKTFQDGSTGECSVEVIDVLENFELAAQDEIISTPTLVRISPLPIRRMFFSASILGK